MANFNDIFYVIERDDGEFEYGYNSKTNGLYTSVSRAETYKNRLLNSAKKWLKHSKDNLGKFPLQEKHILTNIEHYTKRIQEIEAMKIVPVKIVKV